MNGVLVDNDAKLRIPLFRRIGKDGNPFYTGKLQFPGVMDLEEGASFMVFTSEENMEELQIGPLDPNRQSARVRKTSRDTRADGRIRIDLHSVKDSHGNTFYVGEAQGPAILPLRNGLFFTIFTAREGYEELQVSRLVHKARTSDQYESNGQDDQDLDEDDNYQDSMAP